MKESIQIQTNEMIFLDYEIRSSWWAGLISFKFGQRIAGKYFAWKVQRKFNKYIESKALEQQINNLL